MFYLDESFLYPVMVTQAYSIIKTPTEDNISADYCTSKYIKDWKET